MRPFLRGEIYNAAKSMPATKASGDDGLPWLFYRKYWPIVGDDITNYFSVVLNRQTSLEPINQANIVLISKNDDPRIMTHFRPISLCTVLYKIIATVLVSRFKVVLDICIDEAQSAFIPGCIIIDNIQIAYDILHYLRNKHEGEVGSMALKLGMSKAYDRVEWGFLEDIMGQMGFCSKWIDLIMHCVKSVSYAVVINGHLSDGFSPSRGLRQADPLSPYLLLICSEGFSTLINNAKREGNLKGVRLNRFSPCITHLLFADDSLLFGEATVEGVACFQQIIQDYELLSGQMVNFDKSLLYFSNNTSTAMKTSIEGMPGVESTTDLGLYLGLPTVFGRNKRQSFQRLKDRMKSRVDCWSSKLLSQWGKEVFIKAVLQAIPTYAMGVFLLLKGLCAYFNSIMSGFFWKKKRNRRGMCWLAWSELCTPKSKGVLVLET